ncbi:MAG: hypothetical protein ACLQDL_14605 [Spirochaetia bacterium]
MRKVNAVPRFVRRAAVVLASCGLLLFCSPFNFYGTIDQAAGGLTILPLAVTLSPNSQITFSAIGGVTPYAYSTISGSGTITPAGVFTAPGAADSTVVEVKDAAAGTSDATVTTVTPPLPLTISPPSVTLYTGGGCQFTATGGTPPYTFGWTGVGSVNPATGVYAAPLFVPGGATVTVTDSAAGTASAAVTVLNLPAMLAISPPSTSVPINGSATFTATGGAGGYQFFLVSGVGSINLLSGQYTAPATAGSAVVQVKNSASATANAAITVYSPLAVVPTSVTVITNSHYTFSATGGIPPYAWDLAAGAGSIDPVSGVYSAPGSPKSGIIVRATDSIGNTSTSAVTVKKH